MQFSSEIAHTETRYVMNKMIFSILALVLSSHAQAMDFKNGIYHNFASEDLSACSWRVDYVPETKQLFLQAVDQYFGGYRCTRDTSMEFSCSEEGNYINCCAARISPEQCLYTYKIVNGTTLVATSDLDPGMNLGILRYASDKALPPTKFRETFGSGWKFMLGNWCRRADNSQILCEQLSEEHVSQRCGSVDESAKIRALESCKLAGNSTCQITQSGKQKVYQRKLDMAYYWTGCEGIAVAIPK